jgi:hypothetical protein
MLDAHCWNWSLALMQQTSPLTHCAQEVQLQ